MPKQPAVLPFRGIASNTPFWAAGSPFVPPESMSNAICFDALKDRPRMGSRPGTSEFFFGTFGNGAPVRGCGKISRGVTPSGYKLGSATNLPNTNGAGHTQNAVSGNVFRLNSRWGLEKYAYENVAVGGGFTENNGSPESGTAQVSVTVLAVTPDQTKIIVGETYTDSSPNTVCRVTVRNAETLAVIWSKKMSDTGIDRRIYAVCANSEWVFVATNKFIRVFKLSDGSNPATGNSVYPMNGWSSICLDVKATPDGNTLYALFLGGSAGATLPNGPVVTAGIYAQHFRSGIMKFTVSSVANLATAGEVLTQTIWSPQLSNSDTYYEGTPSPGYSRHGYLRFSEQMPWGPRGLRPVAMALRPDDAGGGVAVIHANAAWGPNGTPGDPHYFAPDGSVGRWNLTTFKTDGTYDWHADGDSIFTEDGGAGFFNDLLNTTARAIAVDTSGNAYFTGRRTKPTPDAGGYTTWAFDRYGDFIASQDLGGLQRGICVMPSSQLIVSSGARNNDWNGASTKYSSLWQMRPIDLAIQRYHPDLGSGVDVNAVQGIGFNGPTDPGSDRDALAAVSDWF